MNKWTKHKVVGNHFTRCIGCHRLICLSDGMNDKQSMLHSFNEDDEQGYKWHMILCEIKHGTKTADRLALNNY